MLAGRRELLENGQADWSMGEAFAFGSLLEEGVHVRSAAYIISVHVNHYLLCLGYQAKMLREGHLLTGITSFMIRWWIRNITGALALHYVLSNEQSLPQATIPCFSRAG